jgi:hypothetical protein
MSSTCLPGAVSILAGGHTTPPSSQNCDPTPSILPKASVTVFPTCPSFSCCGRAISSNPWIRRSEPISEHSPGCTILPSKHSGTADSTAQREQQVIEWMPISTSWGFLLCTGLGSCMTRILDLAEWMCGLHAGPRERNMNSDQDDSSLRRSLLYGSLTNFQYSFTSYPNLFLV